MHSRAIDAARRSGRGNRLTSTTIRFLHDGVPGRYVRTSVIWNRYVDPYRKVMVWYRRGLKWIIRIPLAWLINVFIVFWLVLSFASW